MLNKKKEIKLDFNEIVIARECVKLKGLRLLNTFLVTAVDFYFFIATIPLVQV